MSSVLVSVIIPTRNRSKTVLRAIRSAQSQSHPHIEIIVVDDGSTDETSQILKYLPGISLITLGKSQGAASARNLGIQKARGDFIAFLDSDDEWSEEFLERGLSGFQDPNTILTFCDYLLREGTTLRPYCHPAAYGEASQSQLWRSSIHSMSLVMVRALVAKSTLLESEFAVMHDRRWYQQISKFGHFFHVNRFLVIRNLGEDNLILRRKEWLEDSFRFYLLNMQDPFSRKSLQRNVLNISFQQFSRKKFLPVFFYSFLFKSLLVGPVLFFTIFLQLFFEKIAKTSRFQFYSRRTHAIRNRLSQRVKPASPTASKITKSLVLYVTNQCDARCVHCFYNADLNQKEKSLSCLEIAEIFKNTTDPIHVTLTGGEAFLRNDLHEICSVISSFPNVYSLTIVSNGFSPNKIKTCIEKISASCHLPIHVQISLDGPQAVHDGIRGLKGGFLRVRESVKYLRGQSGPFSKISVSTHTVLHEGNYHVASDTFEITRKWRVPHKVSLFRNSHTIFNLPHEMREMREPPMDSSLNLAQTSKAILQHLDTQPFYKKFVKSVQMKKLLLSMETLKSRRRILPCYAGKLDYVIYSDGQVAICENTKPVGNLRSFNYQLSKVIESSRGVEMMRNTHGCACINGCNLLTSLRVHSEYGFSLQKAKAILSLADAPS